MAETVAPRLTWRNRLKNTFFSRSLIGASWTVNVVLLLGTLAWILNDGKFTEAALQFIRHVRAFWNDEAALGVVTPLMWPRVDALWFIFIAGLLSALGILAGLIGGTGRHRNIRSWLAVMIVMAGWLTLLTTWPELAWRGQVWRVRAAISEFEKFSRQLLADWPQTDGKLEGLGPFMAYPIGKPRTLMFLAIPQVPDTNIAISTVERGNDDDLHFQLAGNDEGPWLVRHLGIDEPRGFFSGLEGEYIPYKHTRVKEGWFLVRYIYAPTVLGEPGASSELR